MLWLDYSKETKQKTVVSGTLPGVGRQMLIIRKLAWVIGKLLPALQRFIVETKVTFGLTDGSGSVGHDRLAHLFGTARELFGISRIPGFTKDAGQKYLLKTCDAEYYHEADFHFGDTIKTVIDVVEVNGASFKLRGRFINKRTGKICVTAFQTIAYANMQGRPTRFPKWLKILLEFSCSKGVGVEERKNINKNDGAAVFHHRVVVTSEMTNAEKNVSHDEYAKMMTQAIELFLLSRQEDARARSLRVEDAYYKYHRDFYFGDIIFIELYAEVKEYETVFKASFFDRAGQEHAFGRQRVKFSNN